MNYFVNENDTSKRIDVFLSEKMTDFSRARIASLIKDGFVFVNDEIIKPSYKIKCGDKVKVNIHENIQSNIKGENIYLDIVYEDNDILIVNKEQGIVVHPSHGHYEHTLVNALINHCGDLSSINGVYRPGIVHRIDKDTSGLLCVAKNDYVHQELSNQLKDHTMARTYIALVRGIISENTGTINLPIGRDKKNPLKNAVTADGKAAITNFKVLARYKEHTLVECHLVTGRTHQIRVHFSYIGHPIEGDPLYGGKNHDLLYKNGQLLTAVELKLIHPVTLKEMTFKIDLPNYFSDVLNKLS